MEVLATPHMLVFCMLVVKLSCQYTLTISQHLIIVLNVKKKINVFIHLSISLLCSSLPPLVQENPSSEATYSRQEHPYREIWSGQVRAIHCRCYAPSVRDGESTAHREKGDHYNTNNFLNPHKCTTMNLYSAIWTISNGCCSRDLHL